MISESGLSRNTEEILSSNSEYTELVRESVSRFNQLMEKLIPEQREALLAYDETLGQREALLIDLLTASN